VQGTAREVELEGVGAERGAAADPNDFVFFYTCEAEHVFFCGFVMKMLMHQAEQDPFKLPEKVLCFFSSLYVSLNLNSQVTCKIQGLVWFWFWFGLVLVLFCFVLCCFLFLFFFVLFFFFSFFSRCGNVLERRKEPKVSGSFASRLQILIR
jgi:hypothetical protein